MKFSSDPPVSVLMPVFNAEPYLAAAIESILNQTFADFEFIIIEDGSTDKSRDIAAAYASQDRRIRLICSDSNQGIARSRNKGLSLSRGYYIASMDADDISLPRRLESQVAFLDEHPEIGVLGSALQLIDSQGQKEQVVRLPKDDGVLRWRQCFRTPHFQPTVMMRRHLVMHVGGYRSEYEPADDRDLWWRLSGVTRLSNLEQVFLLYRIHSSNVSRRESDAQILKSAKVGHRAISEVLRKDVPLELCHQIRRGTFETDEDAYAVAGLIGELYCSFAADPRLSALEKRAIRKDAASRLYNLARSRPGNPRSPHILLQAMRLDASFVVASISRKAQKKLGHFFQVGRRVPSHGRI
jgi:glycosyltransferase involved in cell wall biosynthesis